MSFASLSERVANCHLFDTRKYQTPSLGFLFLFATLACEVHRQRTSHCSSLFRPQRFSRSRRLTPSQTLWAYFIPLPHPGFALQGFAPPPSQFVSSTTCALLPLSSFSYHRASSLAPASDAPSSRPLSRLRSVAITRRFRPGHYPFPSCAFNSSGLISDNRSRRLRASIHS